MIQAAAHAVSSNAAVPGILGFLVVAGMGVALFFLLRSMNKQLRKVTPRPARPGAAPSAKARQPAGDAGREGTGGDGGPAAG